MIMWVKDKVIFMLALIFFVNFSAVTIERVDFTETKINQRVFNYEF